MARSLLALSSLVLILCACTEEEIPTTSSPLDGPHVLTLSNLVIDCPSTRTHNEIDEVSVQVDIFLRQDDNVDILHSSQLLPGAYRGGRIEDISIASGGYIDYKDYKLSDTGPETEITLTGAISPTGVHFDFKETVLGCTLSGYANGHRRPINSPQELDGFYDVKLDVWDHACDADDSTPPAEISDGALDIREDPDGELTVSINQRLLFSPTLEDEAGNFDFSGDMQFISTDPFSGSPVARPKTGTAGGTLESQNVDFELFYSDPEDEEGCGFRVNITGLKTLPSAQAIENAYRMQYNISGSCFEEPFTRHGPATLAEQDSGEFLLTDVGSKQTVDIIDGEISFSAGDFATHGFEITYTGKVELPKLSYQVEAKQTDPETGEPCNVLVEAFGTVRFLD